MYAKIIRFLNITMWAWFLVSLSVEVLKAEIYDFDYEYRSNKYNYTDMYDFDYEYYSNKYYYAEINPFDFEPYKNKHNQVDKFKKDEFFNIENRYKKQEKFSNYLFNDQRNIIYHDLCNNLPHSILIEERIYC